ncbi:MAG: DUF5320 domain-containing protein [Candidatus Aenigmarchaeota archaeon]|nr:DUF5320 domain-containing protein [Candidatus Aenigmarchaeota archaeon]
MPRRDGTGPTGRGPRTGKGFGPCGRGSGFGQGMGGGFGRRYVEPATLTKEEQKKVLEAELKQIDTEKQELEKRLKEME